MDTPTRARSWKRRTQPRVGLQAAEPVLYSTLFLKDLTLSSSMPPHKSIPVAVPVTMRADNDSVRVCALIEVWVTRCIVNSLIQRDDHKSCASDCVLYGKRCRCSPEHVIHHRRCRRIGIEAIYPVSHDIFFCIGLPTKGLPIGLKPVGRATKISPYLALKR